MTGVLAHLVAWDVAPVLGSMTLAATLYGKGIGRLWSRHGAGGGIPWWRVGCFAAGVGAVTVATIGPVAGVAERLFSAHMVQHQLLVVVAAPLLAAGRPGLALVWGFARRRRAAVVEWRDRLGAGLLTRRPVALGLLVLAVWWWHLPVVYETAVRSSLIHGVEHGSLLGVSVAFWASLPVRDPGRLPGSVLSVFTAGAAILVVAALLLFAETPLYPWYAEQTGAAALDDQRLAAMVMWIPSALAGLAAVLGLLVRWIGEPDDGVDRLAGARR